MLGASIGLPIYQSYQAAQAEPTKKMESDEPVSIILYIVPPSSNSFECYKDNLRDFLSGPGLHFFQEFLVREFAVENLVSGEMGDILALNAIYNSMLCQSMCASHLYFIKIMKSTKKISTDMFRFFHIN